MQVSNPASRNLFMFDEEKCTRVWIPKITTTAGISEPWIRLKDDFDGWRNPTTVFENKLLDRAATLNATSSTWNLEKLMQFAARLANPRLVQTQDSTILEAPASPLANKQQNNKNTNETR